ncbi:MAG TPA: zf-HC2 domain-containing protein [Rhizomicrobium sp.]|jgi:phage host-nuclease inhibitor protein Gam
MLSTDSFPCGRAEALRDFAFDELPADQRREMEQHIRACGDCALEFDRLRMTTAALRILPDREISRRIAFVSDEVFQPSIWARFWSSGARLGFASACVLAAAILVSAWHVSAVYKPGPVQAIAQISPAASADQIHASIARAISQTRAEDARLIQTAVADAERRRDARYRAQMVALEENFEVLRKTMNLSYARLDGSEFPGVGQ